MLAMYQTSIPDVYIGEDGNLYLFLSVFSGVYESVFVAVEVIQEDMFVQTANPSALARHGIQFSLPRKAGTAASGELRFSGAGGTFIDLGAQVAYDPLNGTDLLYYVTNQSGTIPNPGVPTAPTLVDLATPGTLNGTMEYAVAFETAEGITLIGAISDPLTVALSQIQLSAIPLGGAGTTARRIYRSRDGIGFNLVVRILDNTTTTYTDNVEEDTLGAEPVTVNTAEAVVLTAEAENYGVEYNAAPSTIRLLSNVPDGVTDVTNIGPFVGGSDLEGTEIFRSRLLRKLQNPETGSPSDLKSWAEEIPEVETATVYPNTDAAGNPLDGHVLVRISGVGGSIPDSTIVNATLARLELEDIANITIHVGTFTPLSTNVGVTVIPDSGYIVADLEPSIANAIAAYINSLEVGASVLKSGIVAAVFNLPGVANVTVTTPAVDTATGAAEKRVIGTVTVV